MSKTSDSGWSSKQFVGEDLRSNSVVQLRFDPELLGIPGVQKYIFPLLYLRETLDLDFTSRTLLVRVYAI